MKNLRLSEVKQLAPKHVLSWQRICDLNAGLSEALCLPPCVADEGDSGAQKSERLGVVRQFLFYIGKGLVHFSLPSNPMLFCSPGQQIIHILHGSTI